MGGSIAEHTRPGGPDEIPRRSFDDIQNHGGFMDDYLWIHELLRPS
jgi:hypothetical protein